MKSLKASKNRYIIFILTVIITIVVNELMMQTQMSYQEKDAELINISGRQRMISQRIAKHAVFLSYATSSEEVNKHLDSLTKLSKNLFESHKYLKLQNLENESTVALDSLFPLTQIHLDKLLIASKNLAARQAEAASGSLLQNIISAEEPFLKNMDRVVSEYQSIAEKKLAKSRQIAFVLSCLSVLVLLGEFIFIIIPFFNEMSKKNIELKEANTQLADFAHITSHNLRAPVGNLNSLLYLYKNSESEDDRAVLFGKFETVITHLTETMNTLVEVLKAREDKSVYCERLTFNEILGKTNEILSGSILRYNAKIHSNFLAADQITYSRIYLESIFLNLISNAIKYSSPDRTPEIFISTSRQKGKVNLVVKDNGLGIDLDRHGKKLFGLNKTFHRHPEAKGVGLYMTKAQIESMGGEISASSEVNVGTSFEITF